MKIEISILKQALEQLLAHTEELAGKTIEIEEDYYWFIPKEELHDPTKMPVTMSLGSLADDWGKIQELERGTKEPFGYMLVWASGLLRALGDQTM